MDYAMLSPEINSGRMYAGPGSGSMQAAAEAWQKLAAELYSAANSYKTVVSGLTAGPWLGPSSASMAAAAASHVAWLNTTAAQAEETANQVQAAVAAYEEAYASVVPPPLIAANRSLVNRLVATNVLGQNTSAIATLDTQYAEMWARDAAAMYGYAGSSAAATTVTPFTPPQQTTNSTGPATQAAAVNEAAGTSAGNAQSAVSSIQQALTEVPSALQSLATAAPAQATDPLSTLSNLISVFLDLPADLATFSVDIPAGAVGIVSLPLDVIGAGTGIHTDDIVSGWNGEESFPGTAPAPVQPFPAQLLNLPPGTVPEPSLSAGLGEANTVGALSVPPTWTIATPAVRPVSYTLPALSAAPEAAVTATAGQPAEGASASTLSQMALAGMAGRAMAGTIGTGVGRKGGKAPGGERAAARASDAATTKDTPATGDTDEASPSATRTVVTGVAAELREFAKLRDEGILTDEEYTEQKNRLLGR